MVYTGHIAIDWHRMLARLCAYLRGVRRPGPWRPRALGEVLNAIATITKQCAAQTLLV